jgi:nucleotide-binding universal stress UspA family protein
MKILIAYDGSSFADRAIAGLLRAGLPQKAEAEVISVAERWLPPPSSYDVAQPSFGAAIAPGQASEQTSRVVEAAHELAIQASKLVEASFPDWDVSAHSSLGSPASEIIERAAEWKADLIVVGSHGRSAIGRFFLGSVSQSVITGAHCSVRVARGEAGSKDSPVRILIGLDGSSGSGGAVWEVARRNWPEGSEVRLVTSVDPLHMYVMDEEDRYAFVRGFHEPSEKLLQGAGLEVSCLVEAKDAKRLLVEEAERWGADSIFVGARGLGRIGRLLIGSTSSAVVARAGCSVEVVRAKQAQ